MSFTIWAEAKGETPRRDATWVTSQFVPIASTLTTEFDTPSAALPNRHYDDGELVYDYSNTKSYPHVRFRPGKHSSIPPQDQRGHLKPIPDTGWRRDPAVPSHKGGDGEPDFMRKPPYR